MLSFLAEVLVFALLISSDGLLEDNECDGSCDVNQNGTAMLQARRDIKKSDTVLVGQISTVKIQSTCSFINENTNTPAKMMGEVPQGDGPWPLAVYLLGADSAWGSGVAVAFQEQMAQRYFYSVSIQYLDMTNLATCDMFRTQASNVAGCINTLCKQKDIDCSLGLAMYGWSQGGQVSSLVGNYTDFPVTAWQGFSSTYINYGKTPTGENRRLAQRQCVGGANLKTPQHKRRLLMGAQDGQMGGDGSPGSGSAAAIIEGSQTFQGPLSCKTPYDCIQEDGSGYYVVSKAETGLEMLHWWFIVLDFQPDQTVSMSLQPEFTNPPDPSVQWGEKTTLDWLAKAALTSNDCNWQCYLDRYPALKNNLNTANFASAKMHYERKGKAEGRDCTCHYYPQCNWDCYLDNYPALKVNLKPATVTLAKWHYETFGKKEGRDCMCRQ